MISLNGRDPRPIYEQLKENFRKLLISGVIARDEKLPSVRELASQLAINPNTIQRAYRELEAEGYIYTNAGKGSFAADVSEVGGKRKDTLLKNFDDSAEELIGLGFERQELKLRIDSIPYAREDEKR